MVKAIIFDMDGLLVDTETICLRVASAILKKKTGREIDVSGFVGRRAVDFFSEIFVQNGLSLDIPSFIAEYRAVYESEVAKGVIELPGASSLVKSLRGKFVIGLVSGSTRRQIDLVLEKVGLVGMFSHIISNDDVKFGKPHPEPYIFAAQKLGVEPAECIVLEDSFAGVSSAKAAGMKCIGVRGVAGDEQDLSKADLVVDSLEDINADVLEEI